MNFGIIGAGNIGSALAKHLTQRGHQVSIANSKGPASLTEIAIETCARAVTADEAASAKDLVIIAVPETAVPDLPRAILSKTKAIVVDTGNYYPSRDGKILEIENGLTESEWVSRVIDHEVVKAFNNIQAPSLVSRGVPSGAKGRVALSVAGNDSRERQVVMNLIDEIGFDAVDAGVLAESWRQQPGSPAYCKDLSADALKSALLEVNKSEIAHYRKGADEAARPYFVK